MIIDTVREAIHNFLAYSIDIFNENLHAFYYSIKRLCFYAHTFFDASEAKEYNLFCKLQLLSTKSILSDHEKELFVRTTRRINRIFENEIIRRHSIRMNSLGRWENYQKFEGEERSLVRLHELSEILFLKWECGKNFDDPVQGDFWHAHTKAIKVENLYMLTKAEEIGIPLTRKYLRKALCGSKEASRTPC